MGRFHDKFHDNLSRTNRMPLDGLGAVKSPEAQSQLTVSIVNFLAVACRNLT